MIKDKNYQNILTVRPDFCFYKPLVFSEYNMNDLNQFYTIHAFLTTIDNFKVISDYVHNIHHIPKNVKHFVIPELNVQYYITKHLPLKEHIYVSWGNHRVHHRGQLESLHDNIKHFFELDITSENLEKFLK